MHFPKYIKHIYIYIYIYTHLRKNEFLMSVKMKIRETASNDLDFDI